MGTDAPAWQQRRRITAQEDIDVVNPQVSPDTSSVPPGTFANWVFDPPEGMIWEILSMQLIADDPSTEGATSGSHAWNVVSEFNSVLTGRHAFDNKLSWFDSTWEQRGDANFSSRPDDEAAALTALHKATGINPTDTTETAVIIEYENDTDATLNAADNTVDVVFKQTQIG